MTTITEWDILKILPINIFPNFGKETPKIIELVHKYRRLVWELTLKQLHHNAQYTYDNLKTICSINIQKMERKVGVDPASLQIIQQTQTNQQIGNKEEYNINRIAQLNTNGLRRREAFVCLCCLHLDSSVKVKDAINQCCNEQIKVLPILGERKS